MPCHVIVPAGLDRRPARRQRQGFTAVGGGDGKAGPFAGGHDLPGAGIDGQRHAVGDGLGKDAEIRQHVEVFLYAAQGDAHTGDDLVIDQQRPVLLRDLPQERVEGAALLQVCIVRGNDDRRHVTPVGLKGGGDTLFIVPAHGMIQTRDGSRYAGDCPGGLPRSDTRAGSQGIQPAVVADLQDMGPARIGAGDPDGGGAGFAAGFQEPGLFRAGNDPAQELRHLAFQRRGVPEYDAAVQLCADGFVHGGEPVAQRHRAQTVAVVDERPALFVPYAAAEAVVDDLRLLGQQMRRLGCGG